MAVIVGSSRVRRCPAHRSASPRTSGAESTPAAKKIFGDGRETAGVATGTMSAAEREAFLAGVHVGVLAVDEPGRGPCAIPVWYAYDDGVVLVHTDASSLKGRLLAAAGRATLTVQTETAPYQYVSVEGPVTITREPGDGLALAVRYLGAELGAWYAEHNPPTDDTIVVRLTPEHWRTFDYNKLFAG
jgi:PPOX class probable F420-dependent enzyme